MLCMDSMHAQKACRAISAHRAVDGSLWCSQQHRAVDGSLWCSQQHGDAVSAVRELTMIPANHGDVARCVASSSNLHPALAPLLGAVVAAAGHGLASQVCTGPGCRVLMEGTISAVIGEAPCMQVQVLMHDTVVLMRSTCSGRHSSILQLVLLVMPGMLPHVQLL